MAEDVKFNSKEATIIDEKGKTILRASKVGDLFLYTAKKNKLFMTTVNMSEVMKWHNSYGHLNVSGLGETVTKEFSNWSEFTIPYENKLYYMFEEQMHNETIL